MELMENMSAVEVGRGWNQWPQLLFHRLRQDREMIWNLTCGLRAGEEVLSSLVGRFFFHQSKEDRPR
jgi:hypothetical protein